MQEAERANLLHAPSVRTSRKTLLNLMQHDTSAQTGVIGTNQAYVKVLE